MAPSAPIAEAGEPATRAGRSALEAARIPPYALAVLDSLRFDGADDNRLRALTDAEWRKALAFCDRAQLTLTLNYVSPNALPEWVRNRIERNIRSYSERFQRLGAALLEIADCLDSAGIEFVVLKGIAHSPCFTPDPLLRVQGDIDIWCSEESVSAARDALKELGYRPVGRLRGRHLPPMIHETSWEWRGDFYASNLPIPIELHYQLWDEEAEFVRAPGERQFWERRTSTTVDGHRLTVLSKPDTLAFASLHLLMHLLHGDLRIQRAWEIANFLHTHAQNGAFWSLWRRCHPESLRRLEAIIFQLVSVWFGASLGPTAEEEVGRLPGDVRLWIERYAWSPVEALFQPNKDEIWLQLSLVESLRDKCSVCLRRILPLQVPERIDEGTLRDEPPTPAQLKRRLLYVCSRTLHHARALVPTLLGGVKWYWARKQIDSGFLRYQGASALFSFGITIFFLLYNLYLLGLGYHEDLLGRVVGCLSLGTVLGALPAAAITRRVGLRNTLQIAVLGSAAACVLRAVSVREGPLFASALLSGLFLSLWAISFSPAIAGLTNERNRASAFSLACPLGVCVGVLGGLVGGVLPGIAQRLFHLSTSVAGMRAALVLASCIAALSVPLVGGLQFQRAAGGQARTYPRNRFLIGFLAALACWGGATGAFNPFFNAFFSQRMRMTTVHIGLVLSCSQVLQVLAMLSAPAALRRLGQVRGIACMQLATAMALVVLALSRSAGIAAVGYVGYMAFQYMSEPGLLCMLMNGVAPGERSGASALYFLVVSLTGSLSAIAAGGMVVHFGYPLLLVASALVATTAAFLFRTLIQEQACTITSATSS